MITLSAKMAELIHADVNALSVLQRLKLPLGVGDKTISEVCEENNVHPELFGAEITNRSWLKQFRGFHVSKTIHYKKDIDAISGATISAVNLLESVNRCSEFMLQLKQNGVLLSN